MKAKTKREIFSIEIHIWNIHGTVGCECEGHKTVYGQSGCSRPKNEFYCQDSDPQGIEEDPFQQIEPPTKNTG